MNSRWNGLGAQVGLFVLMGALTSASAWADSFQSANTSCAITSLNIIREVPTPTSSSCGGSVSNEAQTGAVSASTRTIVGARKVGIEAAASARNTNNALAGNTGATAQTSATASISDAFELRAFDFANNPVPIGFFFVDLLLTGRLEITSGAARPANSEAYVDWTIEGVGGFENCTATTPCGVSGSRLLSSSLAPPANSAALDLVVPFSANFAYTPSDPFVFRMEISVGTTALAYDSSVVTRAQFGNSLDWLGIRDVTDRDGNPVASFTAISADTGIDWGRYDNLLPGPVTPIPEPSSAALLLGGLLALGLACRGSWRPRPARPAVRTLAV